MPACSLGNCWSWDPQSLGMQTADQVLMFLMRKLPRVSTKNVACGGVANAQIQNQIQFHFKFKIKFKFKVQINSNAKGWHCSSGISQQASCRGSCILEQDRVQFRKVVPGPDRIEESSTQVTGRPRSWICRNRKVCRFNNE